MLHSAYELVNPEKNVHLIFIINLGLWIACIIQNVESKVHYSHNSSCCRRSVAPWIIVLLQHTVVTKRVIYKFTFVWYSLKEGTTPGPHHIWRTYTLCPFFGCEKNTDSSAVELMISLAIVCYGDSRVAKHFLRLNQSSNQSRGGAILAISSFLNQIPHHKEPEISVGIFSPTWR